MWLGLQTVFSLERWPLFSVLYSEVPLYTLRYLASFIHLAAEDVPMQDNPAYGALESTCPSMKTRYGLLCSESTYV